MIRRPPRSTQSRSSAASDVYKRQEPTYGAWVSTSSHRGVTVTSASKIDPEDLFTVACGRDVARRSLRVVMHDRNGITSKGLAFFYLAYTKDGWRVWAA